MWASKQGNGSYSTDIKGFSGIIFNVFFKIRNQIIRERKYCTTKDLYFQCETKIVRGAVISTDDKHMGRCMNGRKER